MSKHQHNFSTSTANSEYVNSAGTTLLGSPSDSRKGSHDAPKKYADAELERYEARQREGQIERRYERDAEDREDGRLLPHAQDGSDEETERTNALTRQLTADDDGPPPLPLTPITSNNKKPEKPVSWSQLPRKSQLFILTLARLSEPLAQTSLNSYMFYQLKTFKLADGSTPSDATVSRQAGMLAAGFTGAQFFTAMMWGRLADSEMFGRKRVILIGLLGTAVGALGFGFSENFAVALLWRCVGGILNGNIGVMRTMISEIIKEKRFQSRAFLLLPMTFNVGVIIGPLVGGLLADPVGSYPGVFGPGGSIGGKEGVWWLMRWPYALPNVVNAGFLVLSALALIFGLEETLEGLREKPDWGLRVGRWVGRMVCMRRRQRHEYQPILELDGNAEDGEVDVEMSAPTKQQKKNPPPLRRKLPFRRIWTRNVLLTLLAHGFLAMHVGTFNNLWFVFLSTPRYSPHETHKRTDTLETPPHYHPTLPFTFTGGLALPPSRIGAALAIIGVIGLPLQLLLYPHLSFKLGTVRSYRWSLLLFPLSYVLTPYLSALPSSNPPPGQATGPLIWLGIVLVLAIQVLARTFALPASTILVNNSVPHPSVLGTLHGIAQSVSSFTRTLGPVLAGWLYGVGLGKGVVGLAWWCMAGLAVVGAVAGRFVWEGDGHEIWLEGERERGEVEREGQGKG